MLTIGKMLHSRRKELKMTQCCLAEKADISMVSIRKYEQGELLPPTSILYRISQALELNYDEVCDVLMKEKKARRNAN